MAAATPTPTPPSSAPRRATSGPRPARSGSSPTRSAASTSSARSRCCNFSPRGASVPVLKLLQSAAANAENNYDLDPDEMRITSISVDEGPTMRRYRPRARGRATRIEKRSCHINIALTPIPDAD